MNTYIALLRGINVGGHKKIKMADLKETLTAVGLKNVVTYIQSGNVVFKDASEDMEMLQKKIKDAIKKRFDFEVTVVVITRNMLKDILVKNPFAEKLKNEVIDKKQMYFMVLCNQPDVGAEEALSAISFAPEEFVITKSVIYLFAANGYGKTKLTTNFFEKKLKCETTARNLRTMNKLFDLCFLEK